MGKDSSSNRQAVELMNADADKIISDLETEFQEDIRDIDLAEGSPIPGDPWTTVITLTVVASAGKRSAELIVEDAHDFLLDKYDAWKYDYDDEKEPPSPDELPVRHVVKLNIVDEDGNIIEINTAEQGKFESGTDSEKM